MAEKDLDFKVILNDEQFDAQISKDIKLAEQFNIQLSALLDLKTKVGKTTMVGDSIKAERLQKATADAAAAQERLRTATINTATAQERNATAAANAANAQERLKMTQMRSEQLAKRIAEQTKKQNNAYLQQSRILNELKGVALGYLSIHGASQLLSSLVRVTGEFELQKTTLAAMLGDLNKAEGIITRIQGLAVESPFQFKELTTYAKQLSAFSVPAQELYDTTKMLADISAGLGVGMDRIVLAYGQVRSAAFLRGQEVRQFTEAGIPILDELAKQFSELEGRVVSTTEVFDKISKRLVPFEMVAKVFKDMTSEGGKFFNMQEIQAETLKGKVSNLKDAYEVMLNEIGKGQSENLKGAVDWARKLMTNYEETGKALVSLVAAYGVYRTTLAITTNLQSTLARNLVVLRREFRSLSAMLSVNPYALLAAGITAVGYGIYKASTSLKDYEKIQKSVEDTQQKYTENIALENTKLDALYAKLRVAKKGTEEYDKAKKNIYTQYAAYISELKNEGVAVDNLATLYTNLKDKMVDAAKARYRMTAAQNVEQEYSQGIDNLLKRFTLLTENMGNSIKRELMEVEKEALWQYILGDENALNIPEAEGIRSVATSMLPSGYGYLVDQAKKDAKEIIDTYSKARERIDRLFGEESVESVIPPAAVETPIEDEAEKAVEAIKKEIESLQTLKKEYEDWKALGVSDESIKLSLMGYFPNIKASYGEDFITQLNYATRILEKIKELEKIAPDEAFNLMTSFGLDKASLDKQAVKERQKAFEDSAKAAGRYFEVLRKWTAEDFNINGEGIAFDVSKIASELNEKIKEIELRSTKAKEIFDQIDVDSEQEVAKVKDIFVKEFGADAWEEFWQSYQSEGFKAIENLADKQKEYEKKVAQEKVNDLAQKYVKEAYFTEDIDLTNLEDKTFFQLRNIKKKLQDLAQKEPLKVPLEIENRLKDVGVNLSDLTNVNLDTIFEAFEDSGEPINESTQELLRLTQQIQKAELSVTDFGKVIKKVFQEGLSKMTEEERKALADSLSSAAGTALGVMDALAASMQEIAEISGDIELGEMAEQVSSMTSILSSAAQGAATGGWIGAIVGGATELINQITTVFTTMKMEEAEMMANTRDFVYEISKLQYELGDGFGGVFGEEKVAKALDAQNKMKKALADYNSLLEDLNTHAMPELYEKQEEFLSLGWTILLPGLAGVGGHFAGLKKTISNELKGAQEAYEKGYSKLEAMQVKTKDNSGFANFMGIKDEFTSLKDLAPQLWGEGGVFDVEAARAFLETNTQLNEQQRQQIQNIIDLKDASDEATEALDSYIKDLYGQWTSNLADAISEAVLTGADAWEIFGNTASETIKNIGKDLLQFAFFDQVMEQFKEPLRNAIGDPDAMLEQTTLLMEALAATVPQAQEWLSMFYDQAKKAGIDLESTGAESLASGIKGVTEDTANLLASYLNAIRADVSYAKGQREQSNAYLQQILTQVSAMNAPSLVEYQQQIAANTFNTAIATQAILSRLDSVITSEGGFDAIRTYS